MQQNVIVLETIPETCINIRSRKHNTEKCPNPPTHGMYCGVHYKNPKPWKPPTPKQIAKAAEPRTRSEFQTYKKQIALKIWKWYISLRGFHFFRSRGQAYYVRNIATNDTDFFSADPVSDISGCMFFSYKDTDNHVYAFDIRSIYTLLYRARLNGTVPQNPFTRTEIHQSVIRRVNSIVKSLKSHHISTEWAPLEPPTPEQQLTMKVVDLFHTIDELNYYSSPDWFLRMNLETHLRFYNELYTIWTHRAGLTMAQKSSIVPGFHHTLFRHPPWALHEQSLVSMQKLNYNTIRTLITSSVDRNDRILGAMYVVSTFTLVNEDARRAYPWLYESVYDTSAPESPPRDDPAPPRNVPFFNILGIPWIQDLLRVEALPPLRLPPPAND